MAARVLPNIGLKGFWAAGENGWNGINGVDGNWLTISVLVQATAHDFVAALPAAPADGVVYVVTAGANAQKIAVRDAGAWFYITPLEGWRVYNQTANVMMAFDGSIWASMASGGGGDVDEAPVDGFAYVRKGGDWSRADVLEVNTYAASVTLSADDAGAYVRITAATDAVVTVPANGSVAFAIGTQIHIRRAGGGAVAIAAAGGVTVNTAETLTLRKPQSTATLIKVAANVWDLTGDLVLL